MLLRSFAFGFASLALVMACSASTGEVRESDQPVIGGVSTSDFPDVWHVTSGCTATLIHPRAMLTAAHCCQRASNCRKVELGARSIATTPIVHPEFTVAAGGGISPSYDVTLLVLDHPIDDITPRKLASSPPTVGRPIRFVGFGCNAFGGAGYGTKRTGTNDVGFFGADVTGADAVRFADVFGWHSLASLDGGTPNDDANICPGDSGGPTFWEEGGELVLAGIHSLVGPAFGYSCHVTPRRDWIDAQLEQLGR